MTPYYQDHAVTIYHGDCREILPQLSFNALVTDPPYGSSADYIAGDEAYPFDVVPWSHWPTIAFGSTRMMVVDMRLFNRPPDRVMAWVPSFNLSKASQGGILFRWTPIYCWGIKATAMNRPPYSDVFTAHDGPVTSITKPVSLMSELLSLVDGTVVDPFMGSGSTIRAAKDLARCAIGIEINEAYCEIAAGRMAQEVLPLAPVSARREPELLPI